MIKMYTKQEIIIRSYREGKSQRCISRELAVSRKTVKKYISAYEERLSQRGCVISPNSVITSSVFYLDLFIPFPIIL